MFKFQTTTLLNGLTSTVSAFVDENGVQRITPASADNNNTLTIHRLGKFKKDNVTKIFKRVGTNGTPGKAEVTCVTSTVPSKGTATTPAGIYRLSLYVRLTGSNNSYYANDFVFKGKPYVYEFEVKGGSATAADVAAAAKTAIDRLAARFNDKVFKVTVANAKITLEPIGPDANYIDITKATLQKFDATINSPLVGGEYVDVVDGTLTPAVNPFGNYTELIKDLRLPTEESGRFGGIIKDEIPVAGVVYNQYIIYMCVNRGIMGGDAVGEATKSITAHSIWVPSTGAAAFEAELAKIGTVTDYKAAYTTALGTPTDPSDDDAKYVPVTEPDVQ